MEIDLAQLDSSTTPPDPLRAEICIVGGGIAGLTLAHRLVQQGKDVLLLEAGGLTSEAPEGAPSHDVLQRGEPHPGSMEQGVRALGGTSLTWGGQLLPLPQDASTWPISPEELARFYAQAEDIFGVDDLPYSGAAFFTRLQQPMPDLLQTLSGLDLSLSKFAPFARRNLAHSLGRELRDHPRARVVLHARATELLPTPARDRIEAVAVRSPAGGTHRVEASQIVVAAGTVETVRLLLASRSTAPEGVGNRNGQVGRNFHDHLTLTAATIRGRARDQVLTVLRPWILRGTLHGFKLAASSELRQRYDLTPVLAHLTFDEPDDSGIGTLRELLRARQQGRFASALRETLPHLPLALYDAAHLGWSSMMSRRRYVSPHAAVVLRLNAAQQAPSLSRIALSEERDDAGQPKAVVDWRIHSCEIVTLRAFAADLRAQLDAPSRVGKGEDFDWNPSLFPQTSDAPLTDLDDARHAMGGACMGTDPRSSVVDSDLRVHGLCNLWIASPATFPDGAAQLPSLPLVALSLRLAERLHGPL